MLKTVDDLYGMARSHDIKLLSDYTADFWNDYKANYSRYDKLFRRFYKSFKYFMQDGTEDLVTLTNDFTEDVYNHLMINHKKYAELYRIHVIADNEYSLTDNYNITEIMDRDTTSKDTNVYGSRTDDTTVVTGSRTDSSSIDTGNQNNTTTAKVSPYNNESFYNDSSAEDVIGSRHDSTSTTKGAETDTTTAVKGSETDNLDNIGTENYTLTRKGNIGVQTATDMLDKHKKFWTVYEFYTMIFREIAKELLLV